MSKLVLMIFTLVILATILSNHSVQSRKRKTVSLCTCTFNENNVVKLKKQYSLAADREYLCKQLNAQTPELKTQNWGQANDCTCKFFPKNIVTLKTKSDVYRCKQHNGASNRPSNPNTNDNAFYRLSIPV